MFGYLQGGSPALKMHIFNFPFSIFHFPSTIPPT